ncbi:hypothetical protein CPSG_01194 [Coccidioides posadasii str. Silveira]|uniref:Uncharacterized protein n=1 Tax=Coccidioides posadasii (strain RMSCC 757 / Silveira) TaxID=443226 RepID=E9CRS0_COCPS|nr:hypothetical protein CPSG_01194 [Coccidioides posadasii str. Silveira]
MSFPNTFAQRIQTITKRGKAQSLAATFIQPQAYGSDERESYVLDQERSRLRSWRLASRHISTALSSRLPSLKCTEELSLKPWAKSSRSGGKDQSSQGTRKILDTKCCSTQSYSSMLKGGEENSSQSRGLFRSPRHLSALALRVNFPSAIDLPSAKTA